MEKREIILIVGIVIASIWLLLCTIMEGKNRKYVIIAGIIIDFVLFIVCRNLEMLLIGLVGGILCGLIPINPGKYEIAVRELKGIKNMMLVFAIFFVMMFMIMAIVFPELKVDFSKW